MAKMMKPEYDRLVRAFLRLQKESPARQAEYLAKLQLDDPDQANALRHLLYRDQNLSTAEDSIQYGPVRPEIGGYRLFEQIGKGGMSRVHRGQHTRTGWLAAVKLLRSDSTSTILQDIERLRQEAQIIRNLEHPNIVNVIDFIQTETEVACIMELIDGPTMADIIQTPGLTMIQALNAAIQLCDTLSVVHAQGVIHRDIKPKNIMVVAPIDGTWNDVPAIKLLDFGLAKTEHSNAEQFSLTGQALGTPQYMAPEQLIGNHVSWATDIYAFGEVFYEMLTGQPAFPNQSTFIGQKMSGAVPTLRLPLSDELTKHLRSIIYGCLATNPNARPNIEQLQTQLTNILHEFDADSAQRRATDSMHHATKADARASRDVRVAIIAIELEPVDLQWEQAPQEMAHALRRHDEIVQESLDQHGGEKLKDDGTSRLAYFRDGRGDPIACALDLQAKFQSERWHDLTQLRIKIGIHCAQLPEAIAKRPEVASSRIVQTMNLASGGQILLTQAAAETLMTPAGAEIIYLGSHRLNGSRTVDRLYSITHPILKMRDIPRLPSAVERARHLPRAPTPFINRKQEIEQVTQLLADPNCTLVTIVGAGGLGKTRLATHVATMVADHYRDGIDFVSLEGVVNRADAVRRIVEAVGLMVNPGPSPESQLQSWL
ncbi:MAG: protein kinase, partial [Myxococcota bacterium]